MSSTGGTGWLKPVRILVPALIALALVIAGIPASGLSGSLAYAQDEQQRSSGGLLRFLFRGGDSQPRVRETPSAAQPAQPARQRTTQTRRQAAPAAPQTAAPAIDKSDNARKVLVVGDFVAGGLAEGLEAAFADNADVIFVSRTNGSSGLVRDDYYDWPGSIGDILDQEEPDIVIVMIGANDRQELVVNGRREEPRSEAWLGEYESRIGKLASAIREHEAHLIWVGMVPFRFRSMSSDMIAFNDLYRRVVEEAGGEYVDVWDGFVDEDGAFAANGPDMNGQPAQLRAGDGINITRAGKRKIAFYVEKPLNRVLNDTPTPSLETFGPPLPQGFGEDGSELFRIERTQPVSLNDPALFGVEELMGARVEPGNGGQRASGAQPVDETIAAEGRPGRADDFVRRRPQDGRDTDDIAR